MNQVKPSQSYINTNRASALLEKWAPVIDFSSDKVQAIEDSHTRLNTAILLENQEQWCLNEDTTVGGAFSNAGPAGGIGTQGDTYAAGDARLPKILIPMIRRTFPELIANEIVGVQPMSGPVGLAFALRYKYQSDFLGSGTDNNGAGQAGGQHDHDGTTGDNGEELGYQLLDTRFTGQQSGDLVGSDGTTVTKISLFVNGELTTYTEEEYDAAITANDAGLLAAVTGNWDADGNTPDSPATWAEITNPAQTLVGVQRLIPDAIEMINQDKGIAELLSSFELTGNIPQVEVSFEKTAVEAGTRRLAARWSVELEQDVKNMNGIDIDTEVTNAMSYEIQAEIDREMIMRMIQVAINGGRVSSWDPGNADARWHAERNRTLYSHLVVQANKIAVRNRRGAANFIVATPKVCAILEMLPEFQWMSVNGNVNTQPTGVARVGNLGGRFNVYRDTRTEAQYDEGRQGRLRTNELNYALLGYKGPEFYDTGIIYCPYIPVMVQRTIGPNDFSPRVGLLTRYGVVDHIFGADLYYHLVLCNGINDGVIYTTTSTTANYFGNA